MGFAQFSPQFAVNSLKKIAVEYNGEVHLLRAPLNTLVDLIASLKDQLSIQTGVSLTYYDPEMEMYGVLKNLEDLPADKIKIKVVTQALGWWGWNPDASWVSHDLHRYHSLLVKEGTKVHHAGALEKFTLAAKTLEFDSDQIHKIVAISNPKLLANFENYRESLQGKHRANPNTFNMTDWKTQPGAEKRQRHLAVLLNEISKWEWNRGSSLPVLPMLQGITEEALGQICQQGFGAKVATTTDPGRYGQGVYFTSKINHANRSAKMSGSGKVFLLSAVTPGNVFPITEHPFFSDGIINPKGYLGKPCRIGYQSHHALVNEKRPEVEFFDEDEGFLKLANELVIFEPAQAVPLFVFYLK